jgi:peptidoglycan/xylan/chitin deacetylase (PgdA/CDA1 family)
VRILCYHGVADDPSELSIRPRTFRQHLELLAGFDARIVSLDAAADALAAGTSGRLVCITFDDGYRDFVQHAAPALREHGFPATVFVTTGFASGTHGPYWSRKPPPLLGWSELAELAREPWLTLGAHTETPPAWPALAEDEARREIERPLHTIAERTGARVQAFSYPAGLYGPREIELVRRVGYRLAVTTDVGINTAGDSLYTLRRTVVDPRDGIPLFRAKLLGYLDEPWALRDTGIVRRVRALVGG